MRKLLAAILLTVGLNAVAQRVVISPPQYEPDFVPVYHYAFAEQLVFHGVEIQVQRDGVTWQPIALYDCYIELQWVVATFPNFGEPAVFVRSVNIPCQPGVAFFPAWPALPPTIAMREFRQTIDGVVWRLEPLPDIPGLPPGVRLFKAVPEQTLPLR